MHSDSTVTISSKRYKELLQYEKELTLLEAGGVDNWEGYSECFSDDWGDDEDE